MDTKTGPAVGSNAKSGRDFTYCWLVELFEPDGNSLGYYHTGRTRLSPFESVTTRDPMQAKRYAAQRDALMACAGLLHLQGVWRAVEHGFAACPHTGQCHPGHCPCMEAKA